MTMTGEFVGTPAYMSPEQITAGRTPLDHRTDIYSLGATLYELLTLRPPFAGERRDQVLAQILHKEPVPPRKLNSKVPVDLETICLKCLEKDPDRRYQTAKALADDLRRYLNRFAIAASVPARSPAWASSSAGTSWPRRPAPSSSCWPPRPASRWSCTSVHGSGPPRPRNRRRGAPDQLGPRPGPRRSRRTSRRSSITRRLTCSSRSKPSCPKTRAWLGCRTECSWELTILTDPPGATVSRKPPDGPAESWERLGVTPIDNRRLALGLYHWKVEKPGYATAESLADDAFLRVVRLVYGRGFPGGAGSGGGRAPRTWCASARCSSGGYGALDSSVSIPPFWMDRFEVTNRQFKEFVDQGGYRRQEFWEHPFAKDGKALSWEEAMALFRDTTGRPGPATWALGSYPDGQDEFPVAGRELVRGRRLRQVRGEEPADDLPLGRGQRARLARRGHHPAEQLRGGRAGGGGAVPGAGAVRHL